MKAVEIAKRISEEFHRNENDKWDWDKEPYPGVLTLAQLRKLCEAVVEAEVAVKYHCESEAGMYFHPATDWLDKHAGEK